MASGRTTANGLTAASSHRTTTITTPNKSGCHGRATIVTCWRRSRIGGAVPGSALDRVVLGSTAGVSDALDEAANLGPEEERDGKHGGQYGLDDHAAGAGIDVHEDHEATA